VWLAVEACIETIESGSRLAPVFHSTERFCCHRQCLGERPGAGPIFFRILETVVFSMGTVPRARCSFAFRLPLPHPLLPLSNLGRGHLPDEIIAVSRRVRVSVSGCQAVPHVGLD
jgi:hypothetical protein